MTEYLEMLCRTALMPFSEIQTQGLGGIYDRAGLVGLVADIPIA